MTFEWESSAAKRNRAEGFDVLFASTNASIPSDELNEEAPDFEVVGIGYWL